jgi:4-hydroxy-4-methyl-2-oxoglutarate aldolase
MGDRLDQGELLELARWNTPTVYNGWEQITRLDRSRDGFNHDQTLDYMPQMGPMAGYALTVQIEPGNPEHPGKNPKAWSEYRQYISSVPGPKIVVVQDLSSPRVVGSFWGEVNANVHRALGCVGTITDGAVRDLNEMTSAGFKAIARRLCVGHAWAWPIRWGVPVTVFGQRIEPDTLIHADKHGFLAIERDAESRLLDAARRMDEHECRTVIAAARDVQGRSTEQILSAINKASDEFAERVKKQFGGKGEW